jgi:hypothetical protein
VEEEEREIERCKHARATNAAKRPNADVDESLVGMSMEVCALMDSGVSGRLCAGGMR